MAFDSNCKVVLLYGGELQTGTSLTQVGLEWQGLGEGRPKNFA